LNYKEILARFFVVFEGVVLPEEEFVVEFENFFEFLFKFVHFSLANGEFVLLVDFVLFEEISPLVDAVDFVCVDVNASVNSYKLFFIEADKLVAVDVVTMWL
jgi:hypothetical protein